MSKDFMNIIADLIINVRVLVVCKGNSVIKSSWLEWKVYIKMVRNYSLSGKMLFCLAQKILR